MQLAEFADRIRARLSDIGGTPAGVAVQVGLPRDAIRSVLRGHPPNVLRADEICRALGITLTIGARGGALQSVGDASDSRRANPPTGSHGAARAEYFSQVVDGRLADLFESIAEVYDKAPTDADRVLVVFLLGGTVRSASDWITSLVASGQRPWEEVIDSSELVDGGSPAEEEGR